MVAHFSTYNFFFKYIFQKICILNTRLCPSSLYLSYKSKYQRVVIGRKSGNFAARVMAPLWLLLLSSLLYVYTYTLFLYWQLFYLFDKYVYKHVHTTPNKKNSHTVSFLISFITFTFVLAKRFPPYSRGVRFGDRVMRKIWISHTVNFTTHKGTLRVFFFFLPNAFFFSNNSANKKTRKRSAIVKFKFFITFLTARRISTFISFEIMSDFFLSFIQ